jgi:hypothetical protein
VLVSLSHAFDFTVLDHLLFLSKPETENLRVSGDGVLHFSRLISAGLATFQLAMHNGPILLYSVGLTDRGKALVRAWSSGDRRAVANVLGATDPAAPHEHVGN